MTTRQVQLLLLPDDENALFRAIQDVYPEVKLIDHAVWSAPTMPPLRSLVTDCGLGASLWMPSIYPQLPVDIRSNGAIMGPQIGPVVQWLRSREAAAGVLNSGRWAASYDDATEPQMVDFIKGIWKILLRSTTNDLIHVGRSGETKPERGYRVGPEALERAKKGDLALKNGQLVLRPAAC